MTKLNRLFRNRIGIAEEEIITFEELHTILEKTAKAIPFENLCVVANKTASITKENLIDKIMKKSEGGLCYELNTILYFFLEENGFDVSLIRGTVFNHTNQSWGTIGETHVANIVNHQGEAYLVDTGFGGNLPLTPVPLNGETVTSSNGEFRVKKLDDRYVLEMKLKYKDEDWKTGYAFYSEKAVEDLNELNEIQKIINEHEQSPFNKNPLVTRITNRGNITLTNTSFTQWEDGKVHKEEIDEKRFRELIREYFNINIG
ncbi:arylamine N-acetyltransferase family protein [Metabacillus fastidiosus]|uniref:arylamine N-acetyltransferase family protein n=1 Tax=Metabacillus fastidiosus TaxID=1458 RepID=UPI002E1AECD1|nr:arylamine N-acetyltransferase [Metabacillus fastidiosus]MED4452331.1 arylamine N-acetyltransferase [Metabacillus fastidiosus]